MFGAQKETADIPNFDHDKGTSVYFGIFIFHIFLCNFLLRFISQASFLSKCCSESTRLVKTRAPTSVDG